MTKVRIYLNAFYTYQVGYCQCLSRLLSTPKKINSINSIHQFLQFHQFHQFHQCHQFHQFNRKGRKVFFDPHLNNSRHLIQNLFVDASLLSFIFTYSIKTLCVWFVCLYPINDLTAESIRPKFCCNSHDPRQGLCPVESEKNYGGGRGWNLSM